MKRDLGLIRELLLIIEELEIPAGALGCYAIGESALQIDGYEDDAVAHHLIWLIEGGYVVGEWQQDGEFAISRLSWDGCEFLDDVRDPEIWRKTKERAKSAAGAGLGFMWEIAKAELKTKLGLP